MVTIIGNYNLGKNSWQCTIYAEALHHFRKSNVFFIFVARVREAGRKFKLVIRNVQINTTLGRNVNQINVQYTAMPI